MGAEVADSDLATTVRAMCKLLAIAHPGRTLEVRIPPFAVFQAGVGTRGAHTRGTPGNVVETDPTTFLALIVGSLSWEEALGQHRVHASGPHTDLGRWFPLDWPQDQ